jgi:hypothetical protein
MDLRRSRTPPATDVADQHIGASTRWKVRRSSRSPSADRPGPRGSQPASIRVALAGLLTLGNHAK